MTLNRRSFLTAAASVVATPVSASVITDRIRTNAQQTISDANAIDAAAPPSPGDGGRIEWPVNNQVIQKIGGVATFKVRWRGAGQSVRLKSSGGTVLAESTSGQFSNVVPEGYTLALVNNGVECDTINMGVGNVIIAAGQSNGYSPRDPDTYQVFASAPGRVIVSNRELPNGSDNLCFDSFVDAHDVLMRHSICWIHCFNTLNRPYPTMIINECFGQTSLYDWRYNGAGATPPGECTNLLMRLILTYTPQLVCWFQGETPSQDGQEFGNFDAMMSYLHRVTNTPWLVALDSGVPPGTNAAVRSAQQQIINNYDTVYPGPDIDPFRSLAPGNSHFIGNADPNLDGLLKVGQAWAAAITSSGF